MESKAGLKRIAAVALVALLAGCGVDGAPVAPGGAERAPSGVDRSDMGINGIGGSGETLYGSETEV
ncbi:argininosuccinate lyase [Pseudooceanicola sp. 200-1SW]|uniref:argininosuccinate lyase n=1 Tax=Pseudooceanicola sp. 200-1SW TaxID=3425949 RepID=UPI003D7FD71B